jgi:hypothetical protein
MPQRNLAASTMTLFTGTHTPAAAELICQTAPLTFTAASGGYAGNVITLQFISSASGSPDAGAITVTGGNNVIVDINDSTSSTIRTQTAIVTLFGAYPPTTTAGGVISASGSSSSPAAIQPPTQFYGGVSGSNPATIPVTDNNNNPVTNLFADPYGKTPLTTVTSDSSTGNYRFYIQTGIGRTLFHVDNVPVFIDYPDLVSKGNVTVDHLQGESINAPTIAAGTGAGTPGVAPAISGTDLSGYVTITPGTAVGSDPFLTITFGNQFAAPPNAVLITPANQATAELAVADTLYVKQSSITVSGFTIYTGTTITGVSATALAWFYAVLG